MKNNNETFIQQLLALTEEECFEDRGAAVFITYWNVQKYTFGTQSVVSAYCIDGMLLTEMELFTARYGLDIYV